MKVQMQKCLKSEKKKIREFSLNEILLVIFLFTVFTIWFTYPLILVMNDSVHDEGDSVANLWLLTRNMNKLLYDRGEFFYSDDVFYPEGFYLASGEMYITETLMGLPVYLLTSNSIFTYNFILIVSFVLSGLGMYILTKFYTKNSLSAFLSAFIFTFCSYKSTHLFQLQLLSIQWLPFTVFYFHKMLSEKKLKYAILSAVFFSLQVLSSVYYAVFTGIFLIFYFLFMIKEKRKIKLSHLIIFILLSLVLIMPFYIHYLLCYKSHSIEEIRSSHILDYFLPGDINEFYIRLGFERRDLGERNIFIGIVALSLSLLGFIFVKKRLVKFYALIGLLFLVLSLGPKPNFSSFTNFLYYLPPFSSLRVPARFSIMVMFSVSMLAGFGLYNLSFKMRNRKVQFLTLVLITILLIFEYWGIFTYLHLENIEVYNWLSKEEGDFAIIELPNVDMYNAMYLFYSLIHKKKLYFGITTFYPKRSLDISITKGQIPELLSQIQNESNLILYKQFTHTFKDGATLNSYVYKFTGIKSTSSLFNTSDFTYLIIHQGNFPKKQSVYTLSFLFG